MLLYFVPDLGMDKSAATSFKAVSSYEAEHHKFEFGRNARGGGIAGIGPIGRVYNRTVTAGLSALG